MAYRILSLVAAIVVAIHPASASETKDDAPAKSDLVEKVEVSGDVARDREDAATFTDLDREEIESRNRGQDLGMLLGETVNAYAYSDAGNGVGYSYLSLRGFNQQRIAVAVNGVPLNTPENRSVYYIDLADFAGGLDLVQVQRGPGTSLGGAPAVGGAVNLETGNLPVVEGGRLEIGAGSYGTVRASLSYGGPLAGGSRPAQPWRDCPWRTARRSVDHYIPDGRRVFSEARRRRSGRRRRRWTIRKIVVGGAASVREVPFRPGPQRARNRRALSTSGSAAAFTRCSIPLRKRRSHRNCFG